MRVAPTPVVEIPSDEEEDLEEDKELAAEPALAPSSESSVDGGPGWLVESGSDSSH